MTQALSLENLLAYGLQVVALVGAGALLAWAFRLREPRVGVLYWRALLTACMILPLVQPWTHELMQLPVARQTASAVVTASGAPRTAGPAVTSAELVWLVLAAGIVSRIVWTGLGLLRLRRYRRRARASWDPPPFVSEFRCALAPHASICLSDEIRGPVTFGLFKPMVLLPDSFLTRPESVQRAVVCHELLHVARWDAAYALAEELAAALLWFHPAVWWLVRRIRLACEQAVDLQAVEMIADRKQYLDAVLQTAGVQVPAPGTGFASPFLNRSQLVERVALIAKEIRMSKSRVFASTLSSAVLVLAAAALAVRAFPLKGEPQSAAPQQQSDRVRIGPDVLSKMLVSSHSCTSPESTGVNVNLEVVIGKDGSVIAVSTIPSAPPAALAAAECVKTWRFDPLIVGGKALEAVAIVKIPLTSPDGKPPEKNMTVLVEPGVIVSGGPIGGVVGGVPGGVGQGVGGGVGGGIGRGAPRRVVAQFSGKGDLSEQQSQPFPAPEPGKTRVRVGANVQQRKLDDAPEPVYPPLAMQARIQGTVRCQVLLSETGDVKNVSLVSGHPLLVPAAMEALRQYKYKPTLLNGLPVEIVTDVDVPFRLQQ